MAVIESVCMYMQACFEAEDYTELKRCQKRLCKQRVTRSEIPSGNDDADGDGTMRYVSFDGDVDKLNAAFRQYLSDHFTADEYEPERREWADIGSVESRAGDVPTEEQLDAVWKSCPWSKAGGVDDLPKEAVDVCASIKQDVFKLVCAMWVTEVVPHSVVVVVFVMLHKGKGKKVDSLKSYRPIGLETLVLKVLEGLLTLRLAPVLALLPVTQVAYQAGKSTIDNIMWIRCTIQRLHVIGMTAILGLLDASGAFDTLSWRLIDEALERKGASVKCRAVFRAIYRAVSGVVRTRVPDGTVSFSDRFGITRGVIQGGKCSPLLWIIGLAHLLCGCDPARIALVGPGERAVRKNLTKRRSLRATGQAGIPQRTS